MSLLRVNNVVAGYGSAQVLFDVALHIEPGQMISLLGRNGMGKTTTIKTITGQLPVRGGSVSIDGNNTSSWTSHNIAQLGVGLVPEGRQIFPNLSAEENLLATAANRFAHPDPWTLERVCELFPALRARLGSMGNLLSGGEQQMLAIGRALMTNPKLLLLDDATEGLAPRIRNEIWRALEMLKSEGLGILVVDKHVSDLLPLVDQHYVMEKGRIVWQGDRERWLAEPGTHARYLGV